MSFPHSERVPSAIAQVALLTGALSASVLWAHGRSHAPGASHSPSTSEKVSEVRRAPLVEQNLADRPLAARHGGQVTTTKSHYFEVVYLPQQTRVYVYLPAHRQMNIRSVKGEVTMQVNGNPQLFHYALKPAFERSELSAEPGYLAADVDVTRVRDADLQVTFDLSHLLRDEPKVRFTQTFYLTRPPIPVAVVQLSEADRPLVERQRMCPVMTDSVLGSHRPPIKLMVGHQPLFVCCQGCVGKVEQNPDLYLAKVVRGQQPDASPTHDAWFYQESAANVSGSGGSCCSDRKKGSYCH